MSHSAPPECLVDEHGAIRFGMYDAPIRDVDLDRFKVAGLPRSLSWLRLKQWQHLCIVHPRMALTFAVVDAAFTRAVWVRFIDRETGESFEHHHQGAMLKMGVSRSLWNEHTWTRKRGLEVDVHNHLDQGRHVIAIDATGGPGVVKAKLECLHDLGAIQPLVVALPVGDGRAMYSHKVPLPVRGTITAGEKTYTLDAEECFAILDVHKAHYPRRTWWKWATFAGKDAKGRRIGLNLTRNVVIDDALNENAVWIDGKLHPLGTARFDLDGEDWSMGTEDGAVALTFDAQGERREDLNLGLVVSRFRQRFGTYTGTVRVSEEVIEIDGLYGVSEDHHAVW